MLDDWEGDGTTSPKLTNHIESPNATDESSTQHQGIMYAVNLSAGNDDFNIARYETTGSISSDKQYNSDSLQR